jgi:hypothetical protein
MRVNLIEDSKTTSAMDYMLIDMAVTFHGILHRSMAGRHLRNAADRDNQDR